MKPHMKETVKRLKELYVLNKNLELFYMKVREREKRVFLKGLLTQLIRQKRRFNRAIQKHLMRYTNKDPFKEEKHLAEFHKFLPDSGKQKIEAVCLTMEMNSYKLCQAALSQTTIGEIRATLLEHRQQMRDLLENLKTMNKYVI
ncbi:hypothetical protein [Salegentibacter sp.]|uniref:hypothetical protein n=1 Tax=Salegentibacter sp. TaxID=1903072 RepID=UPI003563421F